MTQGNRTTERSQSRAVLLASLLCASFPPRANALIAIPRLVAGKAYPTPALLPRAPTKLETTRDNNEGDDFATFSDFGEEEDGQQLAREFYQELQNRETSLTDDEKHSMVDDRDAKKKEGSRNTIRTVTVRANRRAVTKQRTTTSPPPDSSPLLQLISFLSPPARPAQSAGLFSGSGTTVYSSGRSIRAEIEILEATMKNNDAKDDSLWDSFYAGSPEQAEEVFRLLALALLVMSAAYVAVEASGGTAMMSWEDAAASFNDAMSMMTWEDAAASFNDAMSTMTDATKDGMSDILVSVNGGDVFLGEEAAWLMRESAEWAASLGEAVRSVEDFVLC